MNIASSERAGRMLDSERFIRRDQVPVCQTHESPSRAINQCNAGMQEEWVEGSGTSGELEPNPVVQPLRRQALNWTSSKQDAQLFLSTSYGGFTANDVRANVQVVS